MRDSFTMTFETKIDMEDGICEIDWTEVSILPTRKGTNRLTPAPTTPDEMEAWYRVLFSSGIRIDKIKMNEKAIRDLHNLYNPPLMKVLKTVCECDIKDLMSIGHTANCPERK